MYDCVCSFHRHTFLAAVHCLALNFVAVAAATVTCRLQLDLQRWFDPVNGGHDKSVFKLLAEMRLLPSITAMDSKLSHDSSNLQVQLVVLVVCDLGLSVVKGGQSIFSRPPGFMYISVYFWYRISDQKPYCTFR